MIDGIYSVAFRGVADWGMGLWVLRRGTVTGVDVANALYDGKYLETPTVVDVQLNVTVPPGAKLVQGVRPRPDSFTFTVATLIPKAIIGTTTPHLVQTVFGPVNIVIRKLRDIAD